MEIEIFEWLYTTFIFLTFKLPNKKEKMAIEHNDFI